MKEERRGANLYAVPMGIEVCISSADPSVYVRMMGSLFKEISRFAHYITETTGAAGIYWADRPVRMDDYLTNQYLIYFMAGNFVRTFRKQQDENVFKLEYFHPVEVGTKGELYAWPALALVKEPPGVDSDLILEFEMPEAVEDMFAKCMKIPQETIKLLSPLMERRLLPFWQEEMYKCVLEDMLWKEKDDRGEEILPVLPADYFVYSSWPRYLPLPPETIKSRLPEREIVVPPDLDAGVCRKLENAGWNIIKQDRCAGTK